MLFRSFQLEARFLSFSSENTPENNSREGFCKSGTRREDHATLIPSITKSPATSDESFRREKKKPENTMSAYKSVLVVGASGRAGSAITAELLSKKGQFEKLGVLTSKPAATPDAKAEYWASLAKQGVEVIRVDLSDVKAVTSVLKGGNSPISSACSSCALLSSFQSVLVWRSQKGPVEA